MYVAKNESFRQNVQIYISFSDIHLPCHICGTLKTSEDLISRRYEFHWKKSLLFSIVQKGSNCKWIDGNSNKAGTISVTMGEYE